MDVPDSRKRPLDGDAEEGVSKRSNQGGIVHATDNVHLKVLVPAIAAGAIIGKGGETITQVQKETGANIKMSKANDYYPGTSERVCLITGTAESVEQVHHFIMEKIREKPDPNPKPVEGDIKANLERHKQVTAVQEFMVKVLVPNTTAGMIIGKGGNHIRQIKEETGAYVQISQKSTETNLPERCVTIAAGDMDQCRRAVEMILQKVMEDPQSASCPNISYADVKGPIASSNPTGSPFANSPGGRMEGMGAAPPGGMFGMNNSMNNLHINANQGMANPAMENLRATLRASGYTDQATEELSTAVYTLASYGFLNLCGIGGIGGMNGGAGGFGGMGQQTQGNLTLANLAGILTGANTNANNSAGLLPNTTNGTPGDGNPSVFGPVGSTTTTMAGGDTGENAATNSYFGASGGMPNNDNSNMFNYNNSGNFGNGGSGYTGTNQNSFGLGTSMGNFPTATATSSNSGDESDSSKKEMEVGEHIVGAILGPGGRGIVELQKYTGANIQISKKGVYSPGTRNRIVTVTGTPSAVQRAKYLIQQRISQEEAKRARQGQTMVQNGSH